MKLLTIEQCGRCPYACVTPRCWYCTHAMSPPNSILEASDVTSEPPSWCPLPNAPEKEEKDETEA